MFLSGLLSIGIFFITGPSGAGKSTLSKNLKLLLSNKKYEIYDFDQNGVPVNHGIAWRIDTSNHWLVKAKENAKKNKSTIVCGITVPSEIMSCSKKPDLPIYFGFLKVPDDMIINRLHHRGLFDEDWIKNHLIWASLVQEEVSQYQESLIIDTGLYNSARKVALVVSRWIESFE